MHLLPDHRTAWRDSGRLSPQMGNWIFGCDVCQEVCPWNEAGATQVSELNALAELLALDETEFRARFRKSAMKRTKRRGLLRNVAIALGNTGNPGAVPILEQSLRQESEPLIDRTWPGRSGGWAVSSRKKSSRQPARLSATPRWPPKSPTRFRRRHRREIPGWLLSCFQWSQSLRERGPRDER